MNGEIAAFIQQRLGESFPDAQFEVRDTTGTDDHFEVEISSARFVGLTPIAQHRLVYDALGPRVGHEIHALALRTRPLVAS
jgi:stress-induced morphogen